LFFCFCLHLLLFLASNSRVTTGALSLEVKLLGCEAEADHLPPPSAEVKN
jgi:hypothetical protein